MNIEPAEIKKLDEVVINRIAAGEIIQRPANALKEMIENSLDAKSSNIQITVKDGGLKLLQIQDNGTGIRLDDFQIVCERFTTSKLRKFEDLEAITTYGFRGEALSSISHVAHLNIVSKTHSSPVAYSASYVDGTIKADPKPMAGNQGTIITVEDLFYNMSVRRGALRSPGEEYSKVADVVGKYAVHNSSVGFSLKKTGDSIDIRTMQNSSTVDNIRVVFGQAIAKELMEFSANDDAFKFAVNGHITNLNYSSKKMQFVLFINHRLVECLSLKRRIDQIYTTYLPKNAHPFVYLSLEIDPRNVDVNVHPTKHEVHFLNEDQIVDMIGVALEAKLLSGKESRSFYAQTKLPVTILNTTSCDKADEAGTSKIYDKDLVRTDMREQKLEKFFGPASQTQNDSANFIAQKSRHKVRLRSVLDMQKAIEDDCDSALREIFAEHVFVGVATPRQALVQHRVRLLVIDTERLMRELFYQCVAYNFQNFRCYRFATPLDIKELALIALNMADTGWTPEDGPKEDLAENTAGILIAKAEMLRTYFEIDIDNDGKIHTIPILIDGHAPLESALPRYIIRLACEVNWDEEKPCFESFARETAEYYATSPGAVTDEWRHTVEHVLYSFAKEYFLPPAHFKTNGALLEAANLPQLYKVFERC
ncbi:DNA mismatch repair protein Mlh1 [Atheta coriaria]|uniref:DNA mismatch repair protein Mlh1 n=1 Tax=Dalotia coriaria TaxID=877792 RepID=UPI0031F42943